MYSDRSIQSGAGKMTSAVHSAFIPFICCWDCSRNFVGMGGFMKKVIDKSPPAPLCVRSGLGGVSCKEGLGVSAMLGNVK